MRLLDAIGLGSLTAILLGAALSAAAVVARRDGTFF
jgi:hypothetical protein